MYINDEIRQKTNSKNCLLLKLHFLYGLLGKVCLSSAWFQINISMKGIPFSDQMCESAGHGADLQAKEISSCEKVSFIR